MSIEKRVISTDAIVIGSGAAGAVMAARLAKGGLRIVVLEEGPRVGLRDFDGNVRQIVSRYYRNGGALMAFGRPVATVQTGCCVGGSTVVNGGTCFRTPEAVLENWRTITRGAVTPEAMLPYFEEVERDLHIEEVSPEIAYEGERILLKAAHARGDTAGYVKRNIIKCQGTGVCPFGCPTGAKQSMEVTYIPMAEKYGALVLDRCRVEKILIRDGQAYGVIARRLEDSKTLEVRAPIVALCAGAVHSPLLLRKSLGCKAPSATGKHLLLHPAAHVVGLFPKPFSSRKGPIQSTYIEGRNGDEYVIFGMQYPPEIFGPLVIEQGAKLSLLAKFRNSVTVAVMASDHHCSGRVFRLPGNLPLITYQAANHELQTLVRGILHASELLIEAGASEVRHGIRGFAPFRTVKDVRSFNASVVSPAALLLGSVHPMGTCRMGVDPKTSVVDTEHQVHGVRGLYIPDGSFFPSSLGVNPQVTINAFALRCAERILRAKTAPT
ncbi:GMC family oxidoreductase [Bdellovibrionota bacterium FG-2]